MITKLFTPGRIGPLTLRNRTIRSAAFEGMCPAGVPSRSLLEYHRAVAAGDIGMTTVAYVSVSREGRSFSHQAWMREEIVPQFTELTDAVHEAGALASIQLGHCGNMSDRHVSGARPIAPSAVFNLFGLALPRAMTEADIEEVADQFAESTRLAQRAGFDAVEIHAGHGYLISQFLNRHTNRRRDKWGGSIENRARFARLVIARVKEAAGPEMAVIAKMNLRDGYKGGMEIDEAIQLAKMLEQDGIDALVLSGGFVSKTPMYVMRGDTPYKEFAKGEHRLLAKVGLLLFGRLLVKTYPFKEAYFLEEAIRVRQIVKVPVILVGGLKSRSVIDDVLSQGFDFVGMARPLIAQPDFVARLQRGEITESPCEPCNECVALMYHDEASCPKLNSN